MAKTKAQKYVDEMKQAVDEAQAQVEAQQEAVKQAKDKFEKMKFYFKEYRKEIAQGKEIQKAVREDELIKSEYRMKAEKAVLIDFEKIYQDKLKELKEAENKTVQEQFNKLSKKRYSINNEIEALASDLSQKMQELDQLDREQRVLGNKLGLRLNHRRFSAQENVLTTTMRGFLPIAGHIPSQLRTGINKQDLMIRDAESLKPQKQPS